MSVLAFPRIHFQGRCLINPATANNDDVMVDIDEVGVGLQASLADLKDADASRFMIQGFDAYNPINNNLFFCMNSGWNYFGDASVQFQDVVVRSAVGVDGELHVDDPVVGLPFRLLGATEDNRPTLPVICDLDPSGVATSQLFVGETRLGDETFGLRAIYDTRGYSRWIGWRNAQVFPGEQSFAGAGATWQYAIPKGKLQAADQGRSPVLCELIAAAGKGQGIQVQFCVYLAQSFIPEASLQKLFEAGFQLPNPAEAFLVGTIGVWESGELGTSMIDRLLKPPADLKPDGLPTTNLGPASARVDYKREIVSLNLITTFPEANYDRPPTKKADFGDVRLGLIPADGETPIAISDPIPYGNDRYMETGGIVDVPYLPGCVTPDQLATGTLVLLSDDLQTAAGGTTETCEPRLASPLLTEAGSILTLETDDQATYLDLGVGGKRQGDIAVLVRERGGPPSQPVTICLWEYQFYVCPAEPQQKAHSRLLQVRPGAPMRHRIKYSKTHTFPAGQDTPETISVEALRSGSLTLAFTMNGRPPADDFPIGGAFFAGVRVLPADDYSQCKEAACPTWDFVYKEVFRYYFLIFPAMSKIIPMNDQAAMQKAAADIVARIDPAIWETTLYMPITRDLSLGKRQLILNWANTIPPANPGGGGAAPAKPAGPGAAPPTK